MLALSSCKREFPSAFLSFLFIPSAMVEAFNTMIEDKELYLQCKSNSKTSIRDFSIDKIGAIWLQLFEKLQGKGA